MSFPLSSAVSFFPNAKDHKITTLPAVFQRNTMMSGSILKSANIPAVKKSSSTNSITDCAKHITTGNGRNGKIQGQQIRFKELLSFDSRIVTNTMMGIPIISQEQNFCVLGLWGRKEPPPSVLPNLPYRKKVCDPFLHCKGEQHS